MQVGVVGTGYVGLVTGTCLAHLGHQVTAIDLDERKIVSLAKGEIPIFEPGLAELLQPLLNKSINFSTKIADLKKSEVVFIAVGTPSSDSGAADLKYVMQAIKELSLVANKNCVIILKSTVPVGTAKKVKQLLEKTGRTDLKIVSNPEFLKEGAAIKDFLEPDRIVVGAENNDAFEVMDKLYEPLIKNPKHKMIHMSNVSAELTKYAANCFLATKISFMNEMSRLCEAVNANIEDIKQGIGSDPRIGQLFLNPGPGYGGSCFPKDVKALLHTANENNVSLNIVNAAELVNEKAKYFAAEKIEKLLGSLENKKIALWGLAFKAQTDDVREAASIVTTKYLLKKGVANINIFDPEATNNFMSYFPQEKKIVIFQNFLEAAKEVDALVILTEWSIFKEVNLTTLKTIMKNKPILDMRNLFKVSTMKESGFNYVSLGRN